MPLTLCLAILLAGAEPLGYTQLILVHRTAIIPLQEWNCAVSRLQRIFAEQRIPVVFSAAGKDLPREETRSPLILVTDSDRRQKPVRDSLGFAMVAGERTALARVFYRAANRMACNCRLEPATVLAYAIAHEAGHLLTQSCDHDTGVMRENWTVIDAARMREGSLGFSPGYAARLRRSIAAHQKDAQVGSR